MTGKLGMKKPEDLKKLINNTSSTAESKDDESPLPATDDGQDLFTRT
jgi:hypothetical protein